MKYKVVGLCGFARSGKDTFFSIASEILDSQNKNNNRIAFADSLKEDLDPFIKEHLGFSAFTENSKEKELIRPLMVCFGADIMRKIDENYWVRKLSSKLKINSINFITDVRYPNEIEWIQEDLGGVCINIQRANTRAINSEEQKNGPKVKKLADVNFKWDDLNESNIAYYKSQISETLKNQLNNEVQRVRLKFN